MRITIPYRAKGSIYIALLLLLNLSSLSCKKHKYYRKDNGFENEVNYPAAFVVNGGSNSIAIIDLNDNTVKETYSLKGSTFPHHVYLSPDKSLMAIAFIGSDLSGGHGGHSSGSIFMVQVFNTTTGEHITNIFLKNAAHNAIFSPDGKELWLGQSKTDKSSICIYNTKKWKLEEEVEVGAGLAEITFSTDGTKAYTVNGTDGNVTVLNVADKSIVKTISVGTIPVGAWPASNGKMYVDNEGSKTVNEIDVVSNEVTSTISLGFKPGYVAFNKTIQELWVSDADNGRVMIYKNNGTFWAKNDSIITGSDAHAIVFNADLTKAYVSNQGASNVSLIDAVNHTKIKDISVGSKPNGIALKQ